MIQLWIQLLLRPPQGLEDILSTAQLQQNKINSNKSK
jgi:hypothetical protein